jgi:formate dehydrogenase subunit beta
MSVFANLPVTAQGTLDTIRRFLAQLLSTGLVEAVLVPLETHDGRSVQPALVTDPAHMELANPLLPVIPISGARMVSLVTERLADVSNGQPVAMLPRIAVVMRPCELRATVELSKLRQVRYEQLLTIGIDCVGTYEVTDLKSVSGHPDGYTAAVLEAAQAASPDAPDGLPYRHACTICETPVAWNADISLHTIGVDSRQAVLLEVADESLLGSLGLTDSVDATAHWQAVEGLVAARHARREAELDAVAAQMQPREDGTPGLIEEFELCQRCHNCTVACPICYCKECLFRTSTFAHEPRRYMSWAKRKGAARLPGDTITFQLTRLSHVTTSCVGCGLCTSACPAHLPVDSLFQAVARQTQGLFNYVAGRDIHEPLPVATFQRDELVTLGEVQHK